MDAQQDCKTLKTPCGEFSYSQLFKMITVVFLAGMVFMQFKINQTEIKETKIEIKETKNKTEANTQAIASIQSTVDGIDKTTQTILKHILQKK